MEPNGEEGLSPQARDWLESPMASEAELDAAELQQRSELDAQTRQPIPAAQDLFGEPVDPAKRRQIVSARMSLAQFRRRMGLAGIHPLDVMARAMMRAAEDGDWSTAHSRACDLAPYMAPRLSVIAQSSPSVGGGAVRFTWETGEPPKEEWPPRQFPPPSPP